jgi:hypothetical protein
MPTIRAATPADLQAIGAYLSPRLAGGPQERYRRFFEYGWLPERPNLGFLIDDGGKIGGFLGAIYGRRAIRGSSHELCNISSWHVDDQYRKLSLPMLKALVAQRGYTFTCFSPSPRVTEVLRFFKFQTLDENKIVFTPISGLAGLKSRLRDGWPRVCTVTDTVARELDAEQQRIFADHRPYRRLGQFLLKCGEQQCYFVTARRGHGVKVFADVLSASNPRLLAEHISAAQWPVFRKHGTLLIGIDQRFVTSPTLATPVYGGLRPRLFRSDSLKAADIDALYTEFAPMFG